MTTLAELEVVALPPWPGPRQYRRDYDAGWQSFADAVADGLAAADRGLVYSVVERYGADLGSAYADSAEERAARLFESWCGQWLAGAPPTHCDCPVRLVCQLVYAGQYPFR